ncbi:MAG: methyl-accepting chemotaxis protein [Brevinematales bacterium]|nr:methyl-accepting chemotaxis protein [Brevinematales bacterium]
MKEKNKRFFSLRWRLISMVGAIIVVMLTIMATTYIVMMSKTFTESAKNYIEAKLLSAAKEIEGWFAAKIPLLDAAEGAISLYSLTDKQLYQKYITTMALYTNAEARSIYLGPKKGPKEGGIFYSSDGWVPGADYDWTKRPWFLTAHSAQGISFTAPYIDAIQGDLIISIARPTSKKEVIPGIIALDLGISVVQQVIQRLKITPSSEVYLVDEQGRYLTHEDTNRILKDVIWESQEFSPFSSLKATNSFALALKNNWFVAILPFRFYNVQWKMIVRGKAEDILAPLYSSLKVILSLAVIMLILVIASLFVSGRWLSPLMKIRLLAEDIARGKFVTPDIAYTYQDEIATLLSSFSNIVSSLKAKEGFLLALKEGDFTREIPISSNEDTVGLALKTMTERLSELIRAVKESIHQTMISVEQLKKATQHLSQGSTEQAAAVEEITSSVKEIQSQAKQNLAYATESIEIMKHLLSVVEENRIQLNQLSQAMKKNTEASEQIKAVVKTIDDIAFQINLLALNANVEAARAGKYGKGFAVVADEVRNLAVKSAQAAKDTAHIVEETVQNLLTSDNVLKQTLTKFDQIEKRSQEMSGKMLEIGKLSQAQSLGLDQISQGLTQISAAVQSAAASAEETASAANELAGQTQSLQNMVQVFKTK